MISTQAKYYELNFPDKRKRRRIHRKEARRLMRIGGSIFAAVAHWHLGEARKI